MESIYKNYSPLAKLENEDEVNKYWFIFFNNKVLVEVINDKVTIPSTKTLEELNLSIVRKQYLGTLFGQPSYSVEVNSEESSKETIHFKELRSLYNDLDEDIFLLAGKAYQIVNWDKTHQYCGCCGSTTITIKEEYAKKCTNCGFVNYPRISPAVITAVFKEGKLLLAHNKSFKGNMHSLIAGFVEPGETLEEAAKREIQEEVGIQVKNVKYWGSQPWPFPNSLMVGFTADYESGEIVEDGTEILSADWFDIDNLPELPTRVSIARKIIDSYIEKNKA